ncbi:MAG TPA: IPT/TIG domain-containing protein [Actinomycetota bacterium]|nr:IPT/TIG domain-containing protein [Actinomycetota bacterium]
MAASVIVLLPAGMAGLAAPAGAAAPGAAPAAVTTPAADPAAGAAPASGQGYWLVASDGGIFNYGDAGFFGSAGAIHLNKPVVGLAATADGNGYWLVASDGGIFTYGDAGFSGSAGGIHLNKPIVGMASTADGRGYWLVASDGGIFNYGDAGFFGSAGAINLNKPIVGMAPGGAGSGYWLVASDGGIFNYSTPFYGSAGAVHLNRPIVSMAPTPDGGGYWLVASDGGIFNYGDAGFQGSAGALTLAAPIVGAAGAGTGSTAGSPPVPPVVTSVAPTGGATTGGTAVTITGQHLAGATAVRFGTVAGAIVSDADSQIVATAPAQGAGSVDITVSTQFGTSGTGSADRFTYFVGAPSVSGISPTHGLTTGGTSVTISGQNLAGATAVKFGTTGGTIASDTSTQIVATSPVEGAGTVHVTVTTAHGTSSSTTADQFTYQVPPPSVTKVAPSTASTAGGTYVTINGSNLSGVNGVRFGSVPGTILDQSSTQIFAQSPAGSNGTVDVTLTGPGGTSATGGADHFTYSSTAPATITKSGDFIYANNQPAATSIQADVSPVSGDLVALAIETKFPGATDTAFSVGGVTGGHVSSWHNADSYFTNDGVHEIELWWGEATSSGSSTVNVSFNPVTTETMSDPESAESLDAVVFHSSKGSSTVWTADKTGEVDDGSSSRSPALPTLNPSSTAEGYFGYLAVSGNAGSGSTWGCVYGNDLRSNEVVAQPSVSASISPTAVQDSNSTFSSIGALFSAN